MLMSRCTPLYVFYIYFQPTVAFLSFYLGYINIDGGYERWWWPSPMMTAVIPWKMTTKWCRSIACTVPPLIGTVTGGAKSWHWCFQCMSHLRGVSDPAHLWAWVYGWSLSLVMIFKIWGAERPLLYIALKCNRNWIKVPRKRVTIYVSSVPYDSGHQSMKFFAIYSQNF